MDKKPPITDFDINTSPFLLQIIKIIVPFLDIKQQRYLSIIIRVLELKNTISFYNYASNVLQFSSCQKPGHTISITELFENPDFLNAITPYIPENYVSIIKNFRLFQQMNEMSDIFNKSADTSNTNSDLNPSQQELYNQYLRELDSLDLKNKDDNS